MVMASGEDRGRRCLIPASGHGGDERLRDPDGARRPVDGRAGAPDPDHQPLLDSDRNAYIG